MGIAFFHSFGDLLDIMKNTILLLLSFILGENGLVFASMIVTLTGKQQFAKK